MSRYHGDLEPGICQASPAYCYIGILGICTSQCFHTLSSNSTLLRHHPQKLQAFAGEVLATLPSKGLPTSHKWKMWKADGVAAPLSPHLLAGKGREQCWLSVQGLWWVPAPLLKSASKFGGAGGSWYPHTSTALWEKEKTWSPVGCVRMCMCATSTVQ